MSVSITIVDEKVEVLTCNFCSTPWKRGFKCPNCGKENHYPVVRMISKSDAVPPELFLDCSRDFAFPHLGSLVYLP